MIIKSGIIGAHVSSAEEYEFLELVFGESGLLKLDPEYRMHAISCLFQITYQFLHSALSSDVVDELYESLKEYYTTKSEEPRYQPTKH